MVGSDKEVPNKLTRQKLSTKCNYLPSMRRVVHKGDSPDSSLALPGDSVAAGLWAAALSRQCALLLRSSVTNGEIIPEGNQYLDINKQK